MTFRVLTATTSLGLAVAATAFAEAPPSVAPQPAKPPGGSTSDLERRVADLERRVEVLKALQSESEEASPATAVPAVATQANAFNPTLTVVGNGMYRWDDREVREEDVRVDRQFVLREVELDMRASIDPFADGVAIVALAAPAPGRFEVEVEEGYAVVKRLPLPILDESPWGLKLKVGRFRTEIGRENRLHLHDLPQSSRPLVMDELFGPDGYIADGLSAQIFVPTPFDEDSAAELTLQALAGGGALVANGPSNSYAFVGNLRWFRTFADVHNVDLSLVLHFGRTDPAGERSAATYGVDVLYKWKPLRGGEFRSFVLGGELFVTDRQAPDASDAAFARPRPWGYFAFAQYQLGRPSYLGVRWDDTSSLVPDVPRRRALSAYFTWYASEFLRFRAGYEHRFSGTPEEEGRNSLFAELNIIFGAHPPEPFWVNR